MPLKHKNYVLDLKKYKEKYNLHNYIKETNDSQLAQIYNSTLEQLKLFRKTHFQIVQDYGFNFPNKNAFCTGGTEAQTFLSNIITETDKSNIFIMNIENLLKNIADNYKTYSIIGLISGFSFWFFNNKFNE